MDGWEGKGEGRGLSWGSVVGWKVGAMEGVDGGWLDRGGGWGLSWGIVVG